MESAAEKVVPLKPEHAPHDERLRVTEAVHEDAASEEDVAEEVIQPAPQKTQSDMGRMALLISLTLVLIMAVSYFFLARDIKGLTTEVQALNAVRSQVSELDAKMGSVELRMSALESLPARTRRLVVRAMIQEMASKADFLAKDVDSDAEAAKLQEAITLLRQVEQGMAQ